MAGHSKWANIKHRKDKMDAARGRLFTKLARQIAVTAREGGGDPDNNFRLRLAIEKAKEVNMPNESIERAIKRGTGELGGEQYEEIVYEGYGPGGVAVMLEVMTDNRNRTAAELRNLFARHGGSLGESGCVAWMFEKEGIVSLKRADLPADEDTLILDALEAGARDVRTEEDTVEIVTDPADCQAVKDALAGKGYRSGAAKIAMVPRTTVQPAGAAAQRLLRLLDALEEHADVQEVHANCEIAEEVLQALDA